MRCVPLCSGAGERDLGRQQTGYTRDTHEHRDKSAAKKAFRGTSWGRRKTASKGLERPLVLILWQVFSCLISLNGFSSRHSVLRSAVTASICVSYNVGVALKGVDAVIIRLGVKKRRSDARNARYCSRDCACCGSRIDWIFSKCCPLKEVLYSGLPNDGPWTVRVLNSMGQAKHWLWLSVRRSMTGISQER
ncbi:uncharacterized protein BO80DRAFT_120135 [Aspergillus ibericus CBS 121593]|uniref:Uncharacterized protein n=1 Tax=Aspergillus ibericus CBS 121593 TaxID=1448316 RepID=A0A395GX65_9EURO|nr:hypothetical protein BO80DRAFT_120135 [Aspergillus ibericus CBS 121593]RAK99628.1 hypothetical protein BO80DRAFT_120135 [Aspergillus ibericus CBS 121593]